VGGGQAAAGPVPRPAPVADRSVKLASYNNAKDNAKAMDVAIDREWREAGRAAARVGDELITLHDLVFNVKEYLKRNPPGRSLTRDELNMVAKSVLAGLIERTLIVQEAKRVLKNPKQIQRLDEAADKYWREEELPPLMRRYMADNEQQLKQKLLESGRSIEALRQAFHQEFMAQVFLDQKFAERRKVELPAMLSFYQQHLHDKEFDRPALITWRELVVEKGRHPNPADARKKADDLLAKLKRSDDFATLAKTESEGPSRVREEGGLMQTSPGSYAVEAVNLALASLPLNQVSPVLEGPTSLHIVRVEARREAGPASFEEIQDQIRRKIMVDNLRKARMDFLAKLRRDTLVSTIFDGTESDPARPTEE
jgi:parvulin-like peptidyl-prolyl isomerase